MRFNNPLLFAVEATVLYRYDRQMV